MNEFKTKGKPIGDFKKKPKYGKIKNVIGIISGKGGVGKSTITGIMATMLRKEDIKSVF